MPDLPKAPITDLETPVLTPPLPPVHARGQVRPRPYSADEHTPASDGDVRERLARLEENVRYMHETLSRLEQRQELYAPFGWVDDILVPMREALGNLRDVVSQLAKSDNSQSEKIRECVDQVTKAIDKFDDVMKRVQKDIDQVKAQQQKLTVRGFFCWIDALSSKTAKRIGVFTAILVGCASISPSLKIFFIRLVEALYHAVHTIKPSP